MPLPESPGSRESPANMQRTSVSRLASGRGLFYCIVNLMVWKCLAKKSCSCHSRVENPNKLTDRSRQFDASLTDSQACKWNKTAFNACTIFIAMFHIPLYMYVCMYVSPLFPRFFLFACSHRHGYKVASASGSDSQTEPALFSFVLWPILAAVSSDL